MHELAHALADQHHPLGKYLRKGSPDDDASTARQAVMEGQATWLTWAYVSKLNGGKAEVPRTMIDKLTKTTGSDGNEFPVFSKAPLYLRESLVFPYNEGMKFQDAVFHKLGREGFDEVFDAAAAEHPTDSASRDILREQKSQTTIQTAIAGGPLRERKRQFRVLADGIAGRVRLSPCCCGNNP